ncbi:ABC transporter ATP-binding protein [Pusillimonas noertemannii]|uniref:Amino acid/amide ABC transporter ATP-binding protein 2 (HAAT family) n=1 Tax=Pusillimonas noertemannii TaxID=305977 RepID=A0A2U1CP20_9BURK|nr:ABC transporter ATP-binding protein [Pusillimonas noertemannii]NYT66953.1 ABC transporter ATP-binding protein [Pusillimonas noertemannii]PVY67626.1 amino acid/amide ABC transporter ATP-binding protein 2 (HAAT family) [Pusillimonas noertemannii]TFL12830.1 ABC transporter ATP-binding protein [Pusillimonas noertemannii]
MLHAENLQSGYGAAQVLFGVNLDIQAHQVVSLLGRNGMGKTTTVRTLMGMLPLKGGSITFDGQPVGGQRPHRIAKLGFGLVPEGRRVFPSLSVYENLVATSRNDYGGSWTLDAVYELFPRLKERNSQSARTLSGGEQQMLAIGRALLTNPRLLILDEATEGLAPVIRQEIWSCLNRLKAEGQTILLIDKNLKEMHHLVDRHYIIEKGRIVWSGNSQELQEQPDLVTQYLGV